MTLLFFWVAVALAGKVGRGAKMSSDDDDDDDDDYGDGLPRRFPLGSGG